MNINAVAKIIEGLENIVLDGWAQPDMEEYFSYRKVLNHANEIAVVMQKQIKALHDDFMKK